MCERFWKLRNAVDPKDFSIKESCSIIEISEGEKTYTCYEKENIVTKGWCPVEGSNLRDNKWGFCSPSCKYFSNVDGKSRVIRHAIFDNK